MDNDHLEQSLNDYRLWTLGKDPKRFSAVYAYYLELKRKRLERKGLILYEDFRHVDDEIKGSLKRDDPPYHTYIDYREAVHELRYQSKGRTIRDFSEPVIVYANILDRDGYQAESVTCPNCGNVMERSSAEHGCPYCGTYFELPQDYPRLMSLYSVPAVAERGKMGDTIRKVTLIPGLGIGIFVLVVSFLNEEIENIFLRILVSVFTAAFCGGAAAFACYLIYSLTLLVRLLYEGGRALPLLKGLKSKQKLEKRMRDYDPGFVYEYLEGRLISLLRIVAFADRRKELTVFQGDADLFFFDDLVDMSYRGACQFLDLKEEEGKLVLTMRVFLRNIYHKTRIVFKDEDLIVELVKGRDSRITDHDICKVICPNCGASFDALRHRDCPCCSTRYRKIFDDWIIKDIRR